MSNDEDLLEKIRRLKKEHSSGEFLVIKDGDTVTVRLELDENGAPKGEEFYRTYKDKRTPAIKFPVTVAATGEKKLLGFALKWAEMLTALVIRKKQNVIEITRTGSDTDTFYNFQVVGSA